MRGRSTSFDCIFRLIPKTLLAQVSKAGHLSKGLLMSARAEIDGAGCQPWNVNRATTRRLALPLERL